jgi:hypothetical protein
VPQPDSIDAYTNQIAPLGVSNPGISDSWVDSPPPPNHENLIRLFPHDVPEPDSIDAYTNQIAPLETPNPGVSNIWAASSLGPNGELIIEHFPHNIPQPNSVDAYTDQVIALGVFDTEVRNGWRDPHPVPEHEISRFIPLEIPCLDAVDAYANQTAPDRVPQDASNNSCQNPP